MPAEGIEFKTGETGADAPDPNDKGGDETLIMGKFKTQEEFEAAYTALEQKQSGKPDPDPEAQPDPNKIVIKPKGQGAKAGIDVNELIEEFNENDKLGEATYKKLAAKGLTKDMVDGWVAGQMSLAREFSVALTEAAGGKETLNTALEWASDNMEETEIAELNAIFEGNSLTAAKLALKGLTASMTEAGVEVEDATPNLVEGEIVPGVTGAKPFASQAQMTQAMRDPRYEQDPAYRKEVANRLAVSKFGLSTGGG